MVFASVLLGAKPRHQHLFCFCCRPRPFDPNHRIRLGLQSKLLRFGWGILCGRNRDIASAFGGVSVRTKR